MQNNNSAEVDFQINKLVELPCVSVVIVNYNYGRFIRDAINSVISQSYPRIEVIVVDDVSSDNSVETVHALISSDERYGKIKLYEMPVNSGQMAAMRLGIERSVGEYIIFLDADDVLMPKCVETHIYCHLSSGIAVGFSSVDMVTLVNGSSMIMTTSPPFAKYVSTQTKLEDLPFRPVDRAYPESWFGGHNAPVSSSQVHVAMPPQCEWIWSPTSGNCFRRDALNLFANNDHLTKSRVLPDAYFMKGIASICGSMLIDRPLMGYKVHGSNAFADCAPLHQLRAYDITKHRADLFQISDNAVMHMITNADTLQLRLVSDECYFQALKGLSESFPLNANEHYLYAVLRKHERSLSEVFGQSVVEEWLAREDHNEVETQKEISQAGGLFRLLNSIRRRHRPTVN